MDLVVWGPIRHLPSLDAECLASIAYMRLTVPTDSWNLVASDGSDAQIRGMYVASYCGAFWESARLVLSSTCSCFGRILTLDYLPALRLQNRILATGFDDITTTIESQKFQRHRLDDDDLDGRQSADMQA